MIAWPSPSFLTRDEVYDLVMAVVNQNVTKTRLIKVLQTAVRKVDVAIDE